MAIPITCPGCQAAFDVPESLAGKTIRCTSCKTQLTIPTAVVAGADAKKPFGWASTPAGAKPAAAAPLSLDDDTPPPKAKPANGKAVSKAAVAVDDDDDPRTSNKKVSAKSGPAIKGAPKKRRDEDDADDDDDRPRRKKLKKEGGNGAMIALIGGGVLCLAAIVGLSIWLLSGDDKKSTAKTDNTNNTAPQTPAGATGPTGGTGSGENGGANGGGTGGENGGNTGGDNGGGAVVQPPSSSDGGFAMKPGKRPPSSGGGGNVGTGTPNPAGGGSGLPQTGGGFPQPGGGFTQPPSSGSTLPAPISEGPPPGGFTQPPGGGSGGFKPGGGGQQPPIGGGGGLKPGSGGPGGGSFGQPGGGQVDPNPPPSGAIVDGTRKADVGHFFAGVFDPAKKELITFSSQARNNVVSTRLNRFDATKNFTSEGSYKVPHFVSRAVVDSDKGLLYVATINRPSVSSLMTQQYDQAAGTGDVQVFDLNLLREDKVKNGAELKPLATLVVGKTIRGLELSKDGKLLYVATTTVPSKSAKADPTSYLFVFETETRKPTSPATVLPVAVWDMRLSPDGKALLIIDMVDKDNTTSSAHLLDPASLKEIKKVALLGTANHIAASSGGQYVAVVMTNKVIKLVLATDARTNDLELGFGWKAAAKPGYVEFSPDGKRLFVSGHPLLSESYQRPNQQVYPAGLDVYDVSDANAPTGVKKKASIRTAGGQMVGGHFLMSPEGDYLVFHTGVVVETANVGGNNGEGIVASGPGGGTPFPGVPPVNGGAATPNNNVGAPAVSDSIPRPPANPGGQPMYPAGGGSPRPNPNGGGSGSGQPMYGGGSGMSPKPGGGGGGAPGGGQPMYGGGGGMSPRPGGGSSGAPGAPGGGQPMYGGGGGMSPKPGG